MYETCVCVDIDISPEIYNSETRTARKEHMCCECGDFIQKGQKYEYVNGKWDGDWSTFKTCITCVNIRKDLFNCGYNHGSLWDDIHNAFHDAIPFGEEDDLDWLK